MLYLPLVPFQFVPFNWFDDKNTKKNVKRNQHFESASVQKFLSLFPVLCQEAGRKFRIVDKARSSVPVRCEGHVKALASRRY